jgi:uncharacterized protein (DUF736 family)
MQNNNRNQTLIIGSGWLKTSQNNNQYINGYVDIDGRRIYINIVKNKNQLKEKSPNYTIFEIKSYSEDIKQAKQENNNDIPF